MRIFFWLTFFASWLGLDLYFGQKTAEKQSPERMYPKRKGKIDFFCSGPEFFKQFFHDIQNAQKRVYCLFYIVKDDSVTRDFFHLLKEKARGGVEVHLLMDWHGSLKVKKQDVNDLKRSGVKVGFFGKPRLPYFFFSLQQRNHRKITVIDSTIAYLGGFNVGLEYVNKSEDPKLSPWRDYHLRFYGGSAVDLEAEFIADWNQEGRSFLQQPKKAPGHESGIEHAIYPSVNGNLEKKLINMISSAQRSIFIGTPYFIPTKPVFDQLLHALARGVHVTVLIPRHEDHALVQEAASPFLNKMLLFPNARILSFTNGFYHAKIIIFDDEICDIGTANFDARSQRINFECNCFIYSPAFIEQIRPFLEEDIENSQLPSTPELYPTTLAGKIKTKAAHLVKGFL
ncbi:phospholipase D-like domain-containing protein [Pseudobacillus wudalianchiensis]|uniref:PLD phosphodiesterase domain-containing protein n=1 Tax=Pseudobacillus wudalianchiensis TaxID=1743143 RepID=A0A1B9AY28_9BACI|nr:phosphatidylserine/phosphatidylglycerophosphate/cardiolipin synthase family protein [Bacillus wudalianchiensis]OCA88812.1 hypothetical protein A8F95_05060 [Bacillus wudalianchiensis]